VIIAEVTAARFNLIADSDLLPIRQIRTRMLSSPCVVKPTARCWFSRNLTDISSMPGLRAGQTFPAMK